MSIRSRICLLLAEIEQLPAEQQQPMVNLLGALIDQLTKHLHDNRELAARSTT